MDRKFLVYLPYHRRTKSSFPKLKRITAEEFHISPLVRFALLGNHFLLEADSPARIRDGQISLHFSVHAGVEVQPAALAFGNVRLPHSSSRTLTLHNTGNVPLMITRASFSNLRFSLTSSSDLPIHLAAGARHVLEVRFQPSSLGPQGSTLVLWSHELEHPVVDLSGIGAESQIVIDSALIERILAFFNKVNTPGEIVQRIKDDPGFLRSGPVTYGIRWNLARNILIYRNRLPDRRFDSLVQLDGIAGIGPDTLHDILFSFLEDD